MNKELLLAQLTDLHTTMLAVHVREQKLHMPSWISDLQGHEADQYCGTVACICGWQSLGNLENFPKAKESDKYETFEQLDGIPSRVSDDLLESAEAVFGCDYLAGSIYDGYMEGRGQSAVTSEVFTREELNHPHLHTQEPTALEAASFIALCIEKVKAYEGE